jgi:glutamate synthase domain-containing protein 2
MNPLANAMFGVLFIGVGVVATVLMYYLRGSSARTRPEAEAADKDDEAYLAKWKRMSDDLEVHMADIHLMAETGRPITEAMRTRQKTFTWHDLLIKGAQLATPPLNEAEPVRTQTVIGSAAQHPLVLDTPIVISHMSFGSLSREIKIALAKGSAAVGTAICSGEGGILEDELDAAHKFIFEYVPNQYSVTDVNLQRVDAIEIKIGQSAKPGMGGHLPGNKVTSEIASVRGRAVGEPIVSPARFEDIRTPDDLKRKVAWLRETSGGKPIGVKIAAGNIEADLEVAVHAEPDFITLDGRAGATGAAPKVVKDATSVPTVFAVCRARKYLDDRELGNISLVITGGLRVSSDFAKALALGADAIAIASAALMAAGCQQYRICNTGRCPVGVTSQDPHLRARLNIDQSAKRLEKFLRTSTEELKMFSRLTGHENIGDLAIADVCTTNSEISNNTEIEHV